MRYRVLGTVSVDAADGSPTPLGDRQRAVLAALLARAGSVVPVDTLVSLVWAESPPVDPAAALHSQVSRLRRVVPIVTRPPGYVLPVGPDELDSARFDALVGAAATAGSPAAAATSLGEALDLWRGPAYAGFAETPVARFEAIRLDEARRHAVEAWHVALLDAGRAAESLPGLEAFVSTHPLRERARETLMRTLYTVDRHADALRCYDEYAERLADELGLEPSDRLQRLRLRILRHEVEPAASTEPAGAFDGIRLRSVRTPDGRAIATATTGTGTPLVALPGWVSSIDVVASGRDLRSSVLRRLADVTELILYDRWGTGLSPATGPVDFGLESSVDELEAVVRAQGRPVSLLAMSQAGPVAVALAARCPDLVTRLVFHGTYADGPAVFVRPDLNAALVSMVRAHWGFGSRLFADLYRPGATDDLARHLATVLRDSAPADVAAGYLAEVYDVDVTDLLPRVAAPALVLHYRGDRLVPFAGGRQLAAGLPDARLVPLDGAFHLPDAADLDRVVATISTFLSDNNPLQEDSRHE
jgi:DNA-binding SARP family transcriptional activator/pimeloyl-ACP methyl ester carboxylesterase